jgi:hypothetical protein
MTEKEILTKLYQSANRKVQRLEAKLLKEPYRALELREEIIREGGGHEGHRALAEGSHERRPIFIRRLTRRRGEVA